MLGKVGVVARITLDADAPGLLSHAKHKRPALLGIQVRVRKH